MKMSKKILSLILCFVLIFGSVAVGCDGFSQLLDLLSVKANANVYGDYEYYINDEEAVIYSCSSDLSGSVTIPSEIAGYPVTEIAPYTFFICTEITCISVPDCVKTIGEGAFDGIPNVCYSSSMTATGSPWGALTANGVYDGALLFSDSTKTTLIKCDKSVSGSVTIPDSVITIGKQAFFKCEGITDIVFGNSVETIGEAAFYKCNGLSSVVLPNSVKSIGNSSFCSCSNLLSVSLGNAVESIDDGAFYECERLINITIPDSVTYIGEVAFGDVKNICYSEDMTAAGSPWGASFVNGVSDGYFLFSDSDKKNLVYFDNPYAETVAIPVGTEVIAYSAFSNCTKLTEVSIPDSVEQISDCAFYGCTGLEEISIPDSVTSIGDEIFKNCTGLLKVTIGNNLTSIPYYAFDGCSKLESVIFGSKITSISDYAFFKCTNLKNINIPDGVNSIGNYAFSYCSALESITLPNSVVSIGDHSFDNCALLTEINLGLGLKNIGSHAFFDCYELTSITIPSGVNVIPKSMVDGCKNLKNVTILGNVTSIGEAAFEYCDKLLSINLPDGLSTIDDFAFFNCESLSVTIPDSVSTIGYKAFYEVFNVIYSENIDASDAPWGAVHVNCYEEGYLLYTDSSKTELVVCNPNATGSISVAVGVEDIPYEAFYYCEDITSISLPDTVKNIGEYAFDGCVMLESINIPNGVKEISTYAFANCNNLKNILIPESVTAIGKNAFYNCDSFDTVVIPNSVKTIEYCAFDSCANLTDVILGSGLTSIGEMAFYNCKNVVEIIIPDNVTDIGEDAFKNVVSVRYSDNMTATGSPWGAKVVNGVYDDNFMYSDSSKTEIIRCINNNSEKIIIPDGVEIIGEEAFTKLNLTGVYIPNSVKTIDHYAFYECENLVSVDIPDSVIELGEGVFSDCINLKSVIIGKGITEIPYGAFDYCYNLSRVTIGNNVTTIGENSFYDCRKLKSVVIPDSVVSIESSAFSGCTSLSKLIIGNGVKTIDNFAFSGCMTLKELSVPDNVETIGYGAFTYCVNLKKVTLGNGLTDIKEGTFGYTGLESIVIPDGIESIGDSVFFCCPELKNIHIPAGVENIGENVFGFDNESFDELVETLIEYEYLSEERGEYLLSVKPSDIIICSDSDSCYAKNYARDNDLEFTVCSGHTAQDTSLFSYEINDGKVTITGCSTDASGAVEIPAEIENCPVTKISDYAFYNCNDITSVVIPESVSDIDSLAFADCSGLTGFTVNSNNANFSVDESGVLFNKNKTKLIQYPAANEMTEYSVPDSVSDIDDSAFEGNANIKTVNIPTNVTSIGDMAFADCSALETVNCTRTAEEWNEVSLGNKCFPATAVIKFKHSVHEFSESWISDEAYHYKECTCGDIKDKALHIPASSVIENEVSATYESEGSYDEVIYCSVCNYELSRTSKTIPALDGTTNKSVLHTGESLNVDYLSTVTISANAENIPSGIGYKLVILEVNSDGSTNVVKEGNENSVTYSCSKVKTDHTYRIAVMDKNGNICQNESATLQKDIKVTVNKSFIQIIISFFKMIFNKLSTVISEPKKA